jgi:hypothetical protein
VVGESTYGASYSPNLILSFGPDVRELAATSSTLQLLSDYALSPRSPYLFFGYPRQSVPTLDVCPLAACKFELLRGKTMSCCIHPTNILQEPYGSVCGGFGSGVEVQVFDLWQDNIKSFLFSYTKTCSAS